jgi:hypothetical protein
MNQVICNICVKEIKQQDNYMYLSCCDQRVHYKCFNRGNYVNKKPANTCPKCGNIVDSGHLVDKLLFYLNRLIFIMMSVFTIILIANCIEGVYAFMVYLYRFIINEHLVKSC